MLGQDQIILDITQLVNNFDHIFIVNIYILKYIFLVFMRFLQFFQPRVSCCVFEQNPLNLDWYQSCNSSSSNASES